METGKYFKKQKNKKRTINEWMCYFFSPKEDITTHFIHKAIF